MVRQYALDFLGLAGFGAFVVGVHQVYPPAALMVGGGAVLAFAILSSGRGAP